MFRQRSPILHITDSLYKPRNSDACWQNLRDAVIEQAAEDYLRIAGSKRQNNSELRQIEKFFVGGHCDFLLAGAENVTGEMILDRLREKAKQLRKKRGIVDKGDEE